MCAIEHRAWRAPCPGVMGAPPTCLRQELEQDLHRAVAVGRRFDAEAELARQREHRQVVGQHQAHHRPVVVIARRLQKARQQMVRQPAAAPAFRHGDRKLAGRIVVRAGAQVLRCTDDVDAAGLRHRGHQHETLPRRRVHAACERCHVEVLLVMKKAAVARLRRQAVERAPEVRCIGLGDGAQRDVAAVAQHQPTRAAGIADGSAIRRHLLQPGAGGAVEPAWSGSAPCNSRRRILPMVDFGSGAMRNSTMRGSL